MSTTTNFVTKRILFVAEVRDYGVNTPGYTNTSTKAYATYFVEDTLSEDYTQDITQVLFGVTLTLVALVCLIVGCAKAG